MSSEIGNILNVSATIFNNVACQVILEGLLSPRSENSRSMFLFWIISN